MSSNSQDTVTDIKTFVFLDLETTGLEDDCRITEMCLCAVSRSALLQPPSLHGPPRVLDKLVLCFEPGKDVSLWAKENTGLTRELLQRNLRAIFSDRAADMMKSFLNLQPSPVCLVAHNGYNFDFGILAQHFREVGVEIPREMGIQCVCTCYAFRELKPVPATPDHKLVTLYNKYVGGQSANNAHTAEGDVTSLLQLLHHTAKDMLPWIDQNARGFTHEFERPR